MSASEIADRNARALAVAAATGMAPSQAQQDVATLLDLLVEVTRQRDALEMASKNIRTPPTLVVEIPGPSLLRGAPCPTCGRTSR